MNHQPLEIEYLVPPAKRVSVAGHHHFRESLRAATDDDIDGLVEDIRQAEFEGKGSRP
jgi:hypothetical protein